MGWGQTRSDWIIMDVIRGARGSQSRLIYSNALLYSLLHTLLTTPETHQCWMATLDLSRMRTPAISRVTHGVGVKKAGGWAADGAADGGCGEGGQEDKKYVRLSSLKWIDASA